MNVATKQPSNPDVLITLTWDEAKMLQHYLCVTTCTLDDGLEKFSDDLVGALSNLGVVY